jgi:V/A-type H+/Na+-transporting ATPase subunit D
MAMEVRRVPDQVPPGRAGRLWLRGRLRAAQRSMELLDRKRQLLRREQSRLAQLREESNQRWVTSCSQAEMWGLRAALLGGSVHVALSGAAVAGRASVELAWRNTMGVRHPDDPRCVLPELEPADCAAGNAAVAPAAASYRQALEAGVAYAVADRSFAVLDEELRATERRHRAIERRRIPQLEASLRRLELRLDELEREERVVTRWAQRRLQEKLGEPAVQDSGARSR